MSFVAAGTFIVGDVAAASMGALATGMIGGALVGAGTGALVNGLTGHRTTGGDGGGAIGHWRQRRIGGVRHLDRKRGCICHRT